jgi:hypothetical protein
VVAQELKAILAKPLNHIEMNQKVQAPSRK